jgi:hypothetical protein
MAKQFFEESIRISAFPDDSMAWRIDWFGEIAYPNRGRRRKQPSVAVYMSPVDDGQINHQAQRHVWVSVGTLVLLRIGDIWRNRQLESRPDYENSEFADLQINRSTTSLIKAGLNLDEKGFLIPLNEHRGHRQCTQAYCLMVDLPGERRLIIPCIELIRFYFGSSSSLLSKLFLPPLSRNSLYSKPWLNPQTRQLKLTLGTNISGASAADIGRLHLDSDAWHAALLVGASCLKDSAANRQIFPQGIFPFQGKTTLTACGQWLSFAGQARSTFLVFSLRTCSHPFPFDSLRYELCNDSSEGSSANNDNSVRKSAGNARAQELVG